MTKICLIAIAAFVLLILTAVDFRARPKVDNPTWLVADCIRGDYEECRFVDGHWYYLKGEVWTRDDGLKLPPPPVVIGECK